MGSLYILKNGKIKAKKAAFKILVKFGVLESLLIIMTALDQEDADLQNIAWLHLASWYKAYGISLWFNVDQTTYDKTSGLLEHLSSINIEVPDFAHNAWNTLPEIMNFIKK
jgi:hypothetical protein